MTTESTVISQEQAQVALRSTPTTDLLRRAYSLTHRLGEDWYRAGWADLRAQRDLIDAEILYRADGSQPPITTGNTPRRGAPDL